MGTRRKFNKKPNSGYNQPRQKLAGSLEPSMVLDCLEKTKVKKIRKGSIKEQQENHPDHYNTSDNASFKEKAQVIVSSSTPQPGPLLEVPQTGFKILPILMPFSIEVVNAPPEAVHYCYFKQHETRDTSSDVPADKVLFVTNIPVDTTEEHIKHLFKECGIVERVIFHGIIKSDDEFPSAAQTRETPNKANKVGTEIADSKANKGDRKRSRKKRHQADQVLMPMQSDEIHEIGKIRQLLSPGSSAHVIFAEKNSLIKALNMRQEKRIWSLGDEEIPPLGMEKWLQEYKICRDHEKLQTNIDEFMRHFELAEQERQLALEAQLNQPDEDGFILVTRAARRNTNTDGKIYVTAAKHENIVKLKPKKKELVDFYRFQMREVKRNKLVELRKKFQEDREKIAQLREARRFRPY
ncbi:hypothetical protein G9A89_012245 [Geosiphon pyriformis]|nr:hypothetical protein G9A89_012245 [Geosiphon pyriformis]